jgi:hypothetical protein
MTVKTREFDRPKLKRYAARTVAKTTSESRVSAGFISTKDQADRFDNGNQDVLQGRSGNTVLIDMEVRRTLHCESTASQRLRSCGDRELWSVTCMMFGNKLVLSGCVSSFYTKQLAQEAVRRIPGVELIVNLLEVLYEPEVSCDEQVRSGCSRIVGS